MLCPKYMTHLLSGSMAVLLGACGIPDDSGSSSSTDRVVENCAHISAETKDDYPLNWTSSDLTVFKQDGAWTWFNDERVVVDVDAGALILGAAQSDASVEVVIHDLSTGQNSQKSLGTLSYADENTNPGFVITAPGEYVAVYAHHSVDCNTYWSRFTGDSWSITETFDWGTEELGCPVGWYGIKHNNPWRLSEEGRIYNFTRSSESTPDFLVSTDDGKSWEYGGQLTAQPTQGLNLGNYKFWGNGKNRIDFFATEFHPRDVNGSIYHGYIQGGKSYDSFGNLIDNDVFDRESPQLTEFTNVFSVGDSIGSAPLNRPWNLDVVRYQDGTVGVLWQGRENQCGKCRNPGHHLVYSRFDGEAWISTRLVKGGRTLYRDYSDWWEEDFLGGGALDPDDPNVIYVSTNIDPRDEDIVLDVHEIWKGVTCDSGATFTWEPVTMNSEHENLRPTVPAWGEQNTALLWFRGDYQTAQEFDTDIVGILDRKGK